LTPFLARHDHVFAFFVLAMAAGTLLVYGVRVLLRGGARFDRVDSVGGSALLGKRLVEMGYWAMQPLARTCVRAGITPNMITLGSLALGLGAGVSLALGGMGLGALLTLASGVGDVLDGQVARLTGTGSKRGEVYDASVDRYMEFFVTGGLVLFYRDHVLFAAVALAAMLACFMISYSSAKAEALGLTPPKGAMRRHERGTYLIAGGVFSAAFAPWLEPFRWWPELRAVPMMAALGVVAVVGNVSAVRRLLAIARLADGDPRA
jgi:CDP-diacylglycerol--glycerol-3-phosphate 3-phosphatidyltransferase